MFLLRILSFLALIVLSLTMCDHSLRKTCADQVCHLNHDKGPFQKIGNEYYYVEDMATVNWFEALNICRSLNANLATIESAEQMKALSDYLMTIYNDTYWFWIGGNDLGNEGHFVWEATGTPMTFGNFLPRQPDNLDGDEHCLCLWQPTPEYTMNDWICPDAGHYICQLRDHITTALNEHRPADLQTVPFQKIGTHYYYVNDTAWVNWFEAANICRSLNGHLATINSISQMNALSEYLRRNYDWDEHWFWTGGNDLAIEGQFIWEATGKPMIVKEFSEGQPDDRDEDEHCVNLWMNFTMNDWICTGPAHFICQQSNPKTLHKTLW